VFQSPFGELKIGKKIRLKTLCIRLFEFQSPFGELKIGKQISLQHLYECSGLFQSPFGELKIGKRYLKKTINGIHYVSVPFRGIKNRKGNIDIECTLRVVVSVPFRGIKNRKGLRSGFGSIIFSFQSPFGELKIGKFTWAARIHPNLISFQSPFGELKIGKMNQKSWKNYSTMFQSPFGELKIGKERDRTDIQSVMGVSVPFRGIKNRKDQ